ncbi:EI24 domain-containing protein [Nocardia sp. NPDC004068]|uniref:EI24 domain-containing protein n=1 Tax=Nocardia sp. NPDC004068 TaxID=3364303 RepID=UPI00367C9C57
MRDFGRGFRYLLTGQRWILGHGRQYGFGLLPGLITLVLYLAALIALIRYGYDIATAVTGFADHWSGAEPLRVLVTALLIALALLLAVLSFTAVTLLIGQPFYEALSERVDRAAAPNGRAPQSNRPLWQELWISARDSLRILLRATLWTLLLFALGFLPLLGQTVIPVLAIFVTGFFLTEQLTAMALQRRSIELRERLKLLRSRRMLVWGFGAPLAAVFLIPLIAVFLMPGAVAGATLLVRDLVGEGNRDEQFGQAADR